ncbi:unnamed protein product, partial [Lepidochelys olivacea]
MHTYMEYMSASHLKEQLLQDPLIFRCKEPERHGCAPGAGLKTSLLRANSCKLSTVLAELEQKRKPTHPWSDCISNWKERDCAHSSVLISCCVKMKLFERTSSRGAASGPGNNSRFLPGDSNPANGICKTLYDYQAKSDDELSLQKGVWLIAAPTGCVSRLQANGGYGKRAKGRAGRPSCIPHWPGAANCGQWEPRSAEPADAA